MHLEVILHVLGINLSMSNMKRFLYQKEVLSIMCIIFHNNVKYRTGLGT